MLTEPRVPRMLAFTIADAHCGRERPTEGHCFHVGALHVGSCLPALLSEAWPVAAMCYSVEVVDDFVLVSLWAPRVRPSAERVGRAKVVAVAEDDLRCHQAHTPPKDDHLVRASLCPLLTWPRWCSHHETQITALCFRCPGTAWQQ